MSAVADSAARPADVAHVTAAERLRGELHLPGDKSISHRALLFAALAEGESRIEGAGDGQDVRSTAGIVAALGATVERTAEHGRTVDYRIVSPGADGLAEPADVLDCGNSGTSLRLITGVLCGLPMYTILNGDGSLRGRPVARIEITTPVPSAQVKSAILFAGLRADGRTTVREAVATRDHTERMLRARGIAVQRESSPTGETAWSLEGGGRVQALDQRVPGDVSAAAFWLVAGSIHPDAELTLRNVGLTPTRRAIVDLLRRMGASIEERAIDGDPTAAGDAGASDSGVGEPISDLVVRSSELRAIELGPADVAAAIDEIPVLCLAATQAHGTTVIRGAGELRHKESDRIAGIAAGLSALGATIDVDGDDIRITGPVALHGAETDSLDDHRLAMTFAVAGLISQGRTSIGRPGSASISYPGFFADLERVRA